MMQGFSLSATLPEDFGLGERFWYWRGFSGQAYIHSIYSRELCPPVPGAVYVLVRRVGLTREAVAVGRFGADGTLPQQNGSLRVPEEEVHIHLLARDGVAMEQVLKDLAAMMEAPARPTAEARTHRKPVQLDLLAAA